jgi:hypothetical protein
LSCNSSVPQLTSQPEPIVHGIDEAESVAVAQHAIARIPLASKRKNQ